MLLTFSLFNPGCLSRSRQDIQLRPSFRRRHMRGGGSYRGSRQKLGNQRGAPGAGSPGLAGQGGEVLQSLERSGAHRLGGPELSPTAPACPGHSQQG